MSEDLKTKTVEQLFTHLAAANESAQVYADLLNSANKDAYSTRMAIWDTLSANGIVDGDAARVFVAGLPYSIRRCEATTVNDVIITEMDPFTDASLLVQPTADELAGENEDGGKDEASRTA